MDEKCKEVVHVRAKRGQATDSHSLAERVSFIFVLLFIVFIIFHILFGVENIYHHFFYWFEIVKKRENK